MTDHDSFTAIPSSTNSPVSQNQRRFLQHEGHTNGSANSWADSSSTLMGSSASADSGPLFVNVNGQRYTASSAPSRDSAPSESPSYDSSSAQSSSMKSYGANDANSSRATLEDRSQQQYGTRLSAPRPRFYTAYGPDGEVQQRTVPDLAFDESTLEDSSQDNEITSQ